MKIFIFAVALSQSINCSFGQSLISTDGNYSVNVTGSLSWSLGEISTETFVNAPYQITQGFQQVDIDDAGINGISSNSGIQVYPNPFVSGVNIAIVGEHNTFNVEVFDYQNKRISSDLPLFYKDEATYWVDLTSLSCGLYIVVLENEASGEFYYERIIKSTK